MIVKAIERMKFNRANQKSKQQYLAMYSSTFRGITTDPAAMVISMDDHMVHIGHGVFDTAAICDGLVDFTTNNNYPFFPPYSRHPNCNFNSCFL